MVVWVVLDDEGKLFGVYSTERAADRAKGLCDGAVYCRTIDEGDHGD